MPMTVADRFNRFLNNILLTEAQKADGATKRGSVCAALNTKYYSSSSDAANSRYIGSWGKATRVRPPRDVDVIFELPKSVYDRFQERSGNKQSQLLQEIKTVLLAKFQNTDIRGDGPVVAVPFTSFAVELLPAFKLTNGQYWIPVTSGGGRYVATDPDSEFQHIKTSNEKTSNNTRDLIRMIKCWQAECSVPLKSFWIELLAVQFLAQWEHAGKTSVYYDWMVRDFFRFLVGQAFGNVYAPGTGERIHLGDAWKSRAESARDRATKACEYESQGSSLASSEWQKIFGAYIL
jgi:hypothetical protein